MKLTLRQKINTSILITFVIASIAFSLVLLPLQNRRTQNSITESTRLLRILVDRESEPLANAMFEGRHRAIHLRLNDILQLEGILSLTVFNREGAIISHTDRLNGNPNDVRIPSPGHLSENIVQQISWNRIPALAFQAPISVANETFGHVRIIYSLAKIERERRLSYFAFWGLLGLLLVVMALFMNVLLSAVIGKPISRLHDAITRIQSEGPGVTAPVSSTDEIGELTEAFNRMSRELKRLLDRLQIEINDRAAAEQELSQKRKELLELNRMVRSVASQPSLKEACNVAVRRIADALRIDMVALFMRQDQALRLTASIPAQWHRDLSSTPDHQAGQCLCGIAAETGRPVYSMDVNQDDRCTRPECRKVGVQSFAAIPLLQGQDTIGVIGVASKSPKDFQTMSHFLETVADELAIAVHNFQLLEQTKNDAAQLEQEIANHRKTEGALKESEYRFRTHVNNSPEGIVFFDLEGNLIDANKSIARITGYELGELTGKQYEIYLANETRSIVQQAIDLFRKGIRQQRPLEVAIRKKDGTPATILIRGWLITDEDSRAIAFGAFVRDITKEKQLIAEKKALEEQLIRTQKMEAIGTLAGGIAHDFNNLLGGILGNIELAMRHGDQENEKLKRCLTRSLEATRRATDLVRQILQFSRKESSSLGPTHLTPLVKEALKLSRSTLPATISIQESLEAERDVVTGDPTQLHQVIMNLCVNAYHAMKKTGGTLSVGLRNRRLDGPQESLGMKCGPGEYLVLSVADTGVGIEPDVMERIFEPYFTTKKSSEGTGLGLSVIFGVIKNHGGLIEVRSKPGKGARFAILLPLSATESEKNEKPAAPLPSGNRERILVVDDEDFFRDVVQETLMDLNYQVVVYNSSLRALDAFRSRKDSFDALITDQTMPELTGIQLIAEIRKVDPAIPIVLCTGYSDEVTETIALQLNINRLMHKPISRDDLAVTVRELLNPRISKDTA